MDTPPPPTAALADDDFDTLNDILHDLATRAGEDAQAPDDWEYCDGFLTALLCSRRLMMPSEYFPVLFGAEPGSGPGFGAVEFRDEAQLQTFLQLWMRRWNEVAHALQQPVETLDDPRTLQPCWHDLRGWAMGLGADKRQQLQDALGHPLDELPPIGQLWAVGFLDVVAAWPDDWKPPRERELAQAWEGALADIAALLDDDTEAPLPPDDDGQPIGYSEARLNALGEAIWAAYALHDLARELGAPVPTVRKAPEPGRNDPCPCGSGKKFKKCCGAAA
ncbi:yecA family protein [Tepidimonas alkaliphilus]|uniref:YecA family protein n=1 Tax=Tepidimonas alkaliphilus TaxID=2588942 RepID=A0A554WBU4_9BURK|nr:YecA family protein [Tepidimonas alkaliphilus]TSE21036.1 yecA family protein [Tepidimonas alkaliphilus]